MAKASKPKAESGRKLKVFRTPIGFHDAYVAAPSQKAALEAWGTDVNLFASGAAEQVTDPKLMEEPLANPGDVIKRLRGDEAAQVAALAKELKQKKKEGGTRIKSGVTKGDRPSPRPSPAGGRGTRAKPPKPSREALDAAEERLAKLEKEQRAEQKKIAGEIGRLERRQKDMLRRHEAERDALAEECDRARSAYERAMRRWK